MTQVDVVAQNMRLFGFSCLTIENNSVWTRVWNDLARQKRKPTPDFVKWKANLMYRVANDKRFHVLEGHDLRTSNGQHMTVVEMVK